MLSFIPRRTSTESTSQYSNVTMSTSSSSHHNDTSLSHVGGEEQTNLSTSSDWSVWNWTFSTFLPCRAHRRTTMLIPLNPSKFRLKYWPASEDPFADELRRHGNGDPTRTPMQYHQASAAAGTQAQKQINCLYRRGKSTHRQD